MKLEVFRRIVGTKVFETQALSGSPPLDAKGATNSYRWENSNKLLGKPGILGCKTGITTAAGPCFAGYYEMHDIKLALVLCHSKSLD